MAEYTLLQSGDPDAAENFGAADGDIDRGGIVSGLALSNYDSGAPSIDVAAGKTVHILDTATAEWTENDGDQFAEQRDKVQVVVGLDAQTVGLDAGAVNELFVDPNWTTTDSPVITASTTGAPTPEAEKIGEVDTSADEVSERWGVIEEDGTLSYPDADAATAALSSLPDGVVVLDRANTVRLSNGAISVDTVEAEGTLTDPSGTDHTGELADNSDVSSIQSSSDVDHDSTTGGTDADAHHTRYTDEEAEDAVASILGGGDKISVTYDDPNDTLTVDTSALDTEEVQDAVASLVAADSNLSWSYDDANDTLIVSLANSISVDTLEATKSITDPEGNTITDLSSPIRVLEEVVTFVESNITLSKNKTQIKNGSVQLGADPTGNVTTRDSDGSSTGDSGEYGLVINPNTDLGGVIAEQSSNTSGLSRCYLRDSNGNLLASAPFENGSAAIVYSLSSGTEYKLTADADGSSYTRGYDTDPAYPYSGVDLDITQGVFSDGSQINSQAFLLNNIQGANRATSGDVLVSFDTDSPDDIVSWDLATFQSTLDNETVSIDLEDSTGTTLISDIKTGADISGIDTSKDVRFRVSISRNDTSNNPTIDYLARRFTR